MADNFTQIKNELIRSTKLTPKERSVLFVLMSFADYEKIYIGQSKLAEYSGMKRKSVIKAIDGLREKGFITATIKPDRSTLVYELAEGLVVSKKDNVKEVVSKRDNGCVKTGQGVVSKRDTNNTKVNNTKLNIAKDKIPYKEILDYLNNKAKLPRGYKPSNGSNKFISARWNEGHSLADFKTVIDIKCTEWIGDTKMGNFLRPETLFGNKFQSYLNQTEVKKETDAPSQCLNKGTQ